MPPLPLRVPVVVAIASALLSAMIPAGVAAGSPPAGVAAGSPPADQGSAAASLETLPGFVVEQVLQADPVANGSWICMAKDPAGRLLLGGQRGQPITRVSLQDGRVVKQEILSVPVSEIMGMVFVNDALYVNGSGSRGFGLYRCRDPKGDGSYDDVELLRAWPGGSGEHGSHALVLGPDCMLYTVSGNFAGIPPDLADSSPCRNQADDLPLPRMEDGRGFGAGLKPPGGFIARMDLDGRVVELFSAGQRNTYDIAFNADGELFGWDSDMEWDWGTPWYRPVHVFHAVRGGDQGFREGSAKWPEHYPDGLPRAVTVGIGSPTGISFGTGARFPAAYQRALYVCDWTYGRLIAVHLRPDGASYGGTFETFLAPASLRGPGPKTPLNLTDVVVGDDGALYVTSGGRGTRSGLFRVSYRGGEPALPLAVADLADATGRDARLLRRELEACNRVPDPAAVAFAWPHLGSQDRFIRFAARLALERNPVADWQDRALAERSPDAAFTALLALARCGGADAQPAVLEALASFPSGGLSERQLLEKLRVIEVSIARHGVPTGAAASRLVADVDPLYPAASDAVNRELCQILIALDAPQVVPRTIALLQAAPTREEQIAYVVLLRNVRTGWTPSLRRAYLEWWNGPGSSAHGDEVATWFADAGVPVQVGASVAGFLARAHEEAVATLSPAETAALGDVLAEYARLQAPPPAPAPAARGHVRNWTTADLEPLLDRVGRGRDFRRGQQVFDEARCGACHRYGKRGVGVGPDLTAVATRFTRRDLLESIVEPSKVLSAQYVNTVIATDDGRLFVGRIVKETPERVVLRPDPLAPGTVAVPASEIESREPSPTSPMPAGLLDTFSQDEILDLLAYLESMGNPEHPNFAAEDSAGRGTPAD